MRDVCEQIVAGTLTSLTLASVRSMILDYEASSLKAFLSETKRQGAVASTYRVLTEEEKLGQVMDMASSNSFPSLSQLPEALRSIYRDAGEESEVEEPDDEQQEEPLVANSNSNVEEEPWIPPALPPMTAAYTWFYTVYYRVNGAFKLYKAHMRMNPKDRFMDHKIRLFQEAHISMVRFLDSLPDPSNDAIEASIGSSAFAQLYRKLGDSHYDVDSSMVKVTRTVHQLKKTPLEQIRTAHPDLYWTPEEIAQEIRLNKIDPSCLTPWIDGEWNPLGPGEPRIDSHTLFYGTVYVLNQIKETMEEEPNLRDALWAYYVSFVDLFSYCLAFKRMDDYFLTAPIGSQVGRDGKLIHSGNASPWELYGTMDTRAFTAGDLPDFYHVLVSIPLWGEQHTPSYFIGKIYQKSLPFACQRRHLIKLVVKCIEDDPAFWRVFSKLFWVMLANLYPG